MSKIRRFEYKEGSSNKFYEIFVVSEDNGWTVKTKWGRIGTLGQGQSIPCNSKYRAERILEEKVSQKLRKGYQEVTGGQQYKDTSADVSTAKDLQEAETEVKLPRVWNKLKNELTSGERAIYEKYNDPRTKKRRNQVVSKWKDLVQSPCDNEEVKEVRKSAWLFLRFTYLHYLASVNSYKPATHELARATVGLLRKKLQELPEQQKAAINDGLKKFTNKSGPLSLSECDNGVNAFIETMVHEIREREKVGLGGVSRKRAKMLARRIQARKEK